MMDFLDRVGRPLTRLAVMALMVAVVWFFIRFGDAMARGIDRWARGEATDLNGLAAVLAAAASLLGVLVPYIISLFRDRRIERVEQIRAGAPPPPPLSHGRPSPPEPEPETWPRPFQE